RGVEPDYRHFPKAIAETFCPDITDRILPFLSLSTVSSHFVTVLDGHLRSADNNVDERTAKDLFKTYDNLVMKLNDSCDDNGVIDDCDLRDDLKQKVISFVAEAERKL